MKILTLLAAALCLLGARAAANDPCDLTITYTGKLILPPGENDPAGLDGADFVWEGVFVPGETPSGGDGINTDQFTGEISLTISGSTSADGVYSPNVPKVTEQATSPNSLTLSSFTLPGATVTPFPIILKNDFVNGVGSPLNTLTPVQQSQVSVFQDWKVSGSFGTKAYQPSFAQIATTGPLPPALEITYTGSLSFVPSPFGGTDVAGLDGAEFVWKGSFESEATPSFTNDVNLDRFTGDISLTISGSAGADGVYFPSSPTIGEVDSANDQLQLSNAGTFSINGATVNVGGIFMVPGFDNGAISPTNTLTPVQQADVGSFGSWGASTPPPNFETADYSVSNPQITTELGALDAWCDGGCALAGVDGEPSLVGSGDLVAGTSNSIDLSTAAASSPVAIFVALASTPVAFKGGTLKPVPVFQVITAATDATGGLALPFIMPAGAPAGTELWVQMAILDPAAVFGVSLSNALRGTTP